MKFKLGDRVEITESAFSGRIGKRGVVILVPGMPEYDKAGFVSAERGCVVFMECTDEKHWGERFKWCALNFLSLVPKQGRKVAKKKTSKK